MQTDTFVLWWFIRLLPPMVDNGMQTQAVIDCKEIFQKATEYGTMFDNCFLQRFEWIYLLMI